MIYGPLLIGDTTTRQGIFRVVAALQAIRAWGEEVYYPWIRDHVLKPLAGETMSASDQGAMAMVTETASGLASAGPSGGIDEGGSKGKGKERE